MIFCTSPQAARKVEEDGDDKEWAGATVWKKGGLCSMSLDDRHLEGRGGKVVGHSEGGESGT